MNSIEKLSSKKEHLFSSLESVENFCSVSKNEILDERLKNEIKARLNRIEPLLKYFNDIQTELELLSEPPTFDDSERQRFEHKYYLLITRLRESLQVCHSDKSSISSKNSVDSQATTKLLQKSFNSQDQESHRQKTYVQQSHMEPFSQGSQFQQVSYQRQPQAVSQYISQSQPQQQSQPLQQSQPHVAQGSQYVQQSHTPISMQPQVGSSHFGQNNVNLNLPFIEIPCFYGDPDKWIQFRDGFLSIVDANQSISSIQKMYFLRSHLKADAFEIIKSIPVSENNYRIAWQALVEEFDHLVNITNCHVRAILDIPKLSRASSKDLKRILNDVNNNLRSLNLLGEPTSCWDTLLIPIISDKFDSYTQREWDSICAKKSGKLKMEDLKSFLRDRCKFLEKHENKKPLEKDNQNFKTNKKSHSLSFASSNKSLCHYCKKEHRIYNCQQFLKLTPSERLKEIKKVNACINCLSSTHLINNCTSTSKCRKCNKNHNTLLHIYSSLKNDNIQNINQNPNIQSNITDSQNSLSNEALNLQMESSGRGTCGTSVSEDVSASTQVLLATAIVYIQNDQTGEMHQCRALLDSGSMSNFISKNLCNKLRLKTRKVDYAISGVGSALTNIQFAAAVNIISLDKKYKNSINCLVLEKVTDNLPMMSFDQNSVNIPSNIQLADPTYFKSAPIDILLGSSIFWNLVCVGKIQLSNKNVSLQKTYLGWILTGSLNFHAYQEKTISCLSINSSNSNDALSKFWEIEEIQNCHVMSQDEKFCESHFAATHSYHKDGKFMVRIPFKKNIKQLGNSREFALKRFLSQERRLHKNPQLLREYSKFMHEYKMLGHMNEIFETNNEEELTYYLPHHSVIRETSLTSKVRVVFDGSMKTDSGLSLNDTQYVGPTLQSDLLKILLNFRLSTYVISADISKMYRMVWIHPDERRFQRIFWRYNIEDDLKCFELNTVTYGTASAPYLATKCLCQIAEENKDKFPLASEAIKNCFYVDDFLYGNNSKDELIKVQHEVTDLLSRVGFELRKWLCNKKSLYSQFKINTNLDASILSIGSNESNKTLGISWNSNTDIIEYSSTIETNTNKISKRKILSEISQIFDPLGLLGPLIIKAKLLIQNLWEEKISWDDDIPSHLKTVWLQFKSDLQHLKEIAIPRVVTLPNYSYIELHGFGDSSEKAYGAAVYIRTIVNNKVNAQLLVAKSRVAPLKKLSLPRLELCSALLLAQLISKILKSLNIKFNKIFLWSDSMIALAWIRGSPGRWKTFVANRVGQIQDLTNILDWHHVQSESNPADLLTRPLMSLLDLKHSRLWWSGPDWLHENQIPNQIEQILDDIPEQKSITNVSMMCTEFSLFEKFSSFQKLLRVSTFCYRFIHNSKNKNDKRVGFLTVLELEQTRKILLKRVQLDSFLREYQDLKNRKGISKKSSLLSLNPFIDKDDLLRVGGRLQHGPYSFDKKHPVILPSKHTVTKLIFSDEHLKLLHCGPMTLLASIRELYWPISGRNIAKGVVRRCITCFKAKPKSENYIMGNLPEARITQYLPFLNTGIDYAGPFWIKDRYSKFPKQMKVYVCLFVCLSTKAVHVEAVTSLSTESFIATLKRFIARRGKPSNIYSDNGSNFVGASRVLQELHQFLEQENDNICNFLSKDFINFHRIPARSPNFGGLWEASIKRAKFHMTRIIGKANLNYEEFGTILTQIEAILNSRPLSRLTTSPDDLTALTPAHFLIGRSLTAIPEPSYLEVPEQRLKCFQRLQQIIQHFWQRWRKEYISELQIRNKWKQNTDLSLRPDMIVLLKEDNAYPLQWPIGRVTQLHPGSDGIVRVVSVKIGDNVFKRAVTKICILPI